MCDEWDYKFVIFFSFRFSVLLLVPFDGYVDRLSYLIFGVIALMTKA